MYVNRAASIFRSYMAEAMGFLNYIHRRYPLPHSFFILDQAFISGLYLFLFGLQVTVFEVCMVLWPGLSRKAAIMDNHNFG